MVVLSGGTSKGAGDLSYRILSRLEPPGRAGAWCRPQNPASRCASRSVTASRLPCCRASRPPAIFTFHGLRRAGDPRGAARAAGRDGAIRESPRCRSAVASEMGRQEFRAGGAGAGASTEPVAFPIGKGSGAVDVVSPRPTAFCGDRRRSAPGLDAGTAQQVTLDRRSRENRPTSSSWAAIAWRSTPLIEWLAAARLCGSHRRGRQHGPGVARDGAARVNATSRPVHLLDAASGRLQQTNLIRPGISLQPGWQRMQGFVFRTRRCALCRQSRRPNALRAAARRSRPA